MTKRGIAFLIALAAFASILIRVWINMQEGDAFGDALWKMYRYFTIWTITVTGFVAAMIALGRRVPASVQSGLLLSIGAVAIVFHVLLAHLTELQGLEIFVDFLFHTGVPIAWALFWLFFSPKSGLRLGQIPSWLVFPLAYCVYALMRGAMDGTYPYFFLNLDKQGIAGVAVYSVGLFLAFALAGALIVGVGRLLNRFTG